MKPLLTLSLVGALQGLLLSAYFFQKGRSNRSLLFLGLYIFVFSLGLLEDWMIQNSSTKLVRVAAIFISDASFLYGPLLYLFIRHIGYNKPSRGQWIHFLPFALVFLADLVIQLSGYSFGEATLPILELILFEIFMVQILSYNIMSVRSLKKHRKTVLQTYSNTEGKDLNWLRALLIIITAIYILSFTLSHISLFGFGNIDKLFIMVQVSIIGCIYLMSYLVVFKPAVFEARTPEKEPAPFHDEAGTSTPNNGTITIDEPVPIPVSDFDNTEIPAENGVEEMGYPGDDMPVQVKYKRSGLRKDQAREHLAALQQLMVTEKTFKNPDLNVYILSQKLGISKNHLTQVLNEQLRVNFFEFVNAYRTEEAKQLLLDPDFAHLNIAGIAREVGYKSKATFFVNFKKNTGLSPLGWVKQEKHKPR